jgi:hypothetical protein
MKYLFILLLFHFNPLWEIKESINPDDLKFNGLNFNSEKELIWKTLGKVGEKRFYHECGFFSEDERGKVFFELNYPSATWIGNEEEGYSLDIVVFDQKGQVTLNYKNLVFSGKTTQKEFENLFGEKSEPIIVSGRENENLEWIGLPLENRDDACYFYFIKGKLIEFGYWTPC